MGLRSEWVFVVEVYAYAWAARHNTRPVGQFDRFCMRPVRVGGTNLRISRRSTAVVLNPIS